MRKKMLEKAGIWYLNEISREFLYRPLTPAALVAIQYRLDILRYRQQEVEPMNEIWAVPFKASVVDGQVKINIDSEYEKNLLYIDWP